MGKPHMIFILVLSSIMLAQSSLLFHGNEKIAKFRVYLTDVVTGPNATVLEVGQANITDSSPTDFGWVRVMDDLMTAGPDPNSEKLGRAQGLITNSDKVEASLSVNINFAFTGGEYNGRMLCVVGRKSLVRNDQELPIVGGTGVFRWARGFSISSFYYGDAKTDNILQYDMFVVFPEWEFGIERLVSF